MDLAAFNLKADAEAGAWMVVRNPVTNAPTDARIRVVGFDSEAYQTAADAQLRAAARASAEREGKPPTDAEMRDLQRVSRAFVAAACTLEWEAMGEAGEALPCTDVEKRRVYGAHDWLVSQVMGFVESRRNFSKG